ncbi:amidase family protein [Pannus brasiliensis CCIBt3594]|uniref:Amidase family protein n=1 Tax=Pannus brasiliensis CCIBt3594 TaxID=1427578 RepID=A0AAW9QES8_9CHRO
MTEDVIFQPALELARLIRDREISPLELTESYLERIDRLDGRIGSFVHVARERAIATAREQGDRLIRLDPSELPPFFGVPTAIKDLNAVAGMPISYGVAGLRENIAEYDEAIVTKIKGAGFILLGKTATSQLGSFPYTENSGFPPVRNPRDGDYTAGGSSGGAAAAVAAGFCPIAQGSDGGGSIRTPAACCGLVGIKPSRGRVSWAPVGEYQSGIATNGVISRTVADGAAFLDVISGYTTGDPYWLPDPPFSFLEATRRPVNQLNIAFSTSIEPFGEAATVYRDAVLETARRLAEFGHRVDEISIDVGPLIDPFRRIWQAGTSASGIPPSLLSPLNQWLASHAGTAGEYLQAVRAMQIHSRSIVALFDRFDVLVLPVFLHQLPKIGEWADLEPEETITKIMHWIAPMPIANATGLPAIALPTGFSAEGLPVGVQLVGKPADEGTLLAIAARLEG